MISKIYNELRDLLVSWNYNVTSALNIENVFNCEAHRKFQYNPMSFLYHVAHVFSLVRKYMYMYIFLHIPLLSIAGHCMKTWFHFMTIIILQMIARRWTNVIDLTRLWNASSASFHWSIYVWILYDVNLVACVHVFEFILLFRGIFNMYILYRCDLKKKVIDYLYAKTGYI